MSVEDWQYELFMQTFGWLWFSKEWALKTGSEKLGWVRRFRKVSGWVPKKNAKSPTLAAAGLYTLLADGEMGQKCFSVALDQKQALIAHQHAIEFVNQSPKLRKRCQVHKQEKTITDHWTKSVYSVRAGSKAGASRNSNEGLNGNLFVDESHVVDETQMSILKRAGQSRRQFLHMQLSTAGTNTAGYGYKECLAGRKNIENAASGLPFNFRSKHLEFAVHPDTSLDEIRDPTKIEAFIRQANPSVGRIVSYEALEADWNENKGADTTLTEFAMYGLNLWSTSGGLFVAGSDWNKCAKPFAFKDMKKYPAVVGGDFAKRGDLCCVHLGFAVPTVVKLRVDPFDPDSEWKEQLINIPYTHPYFLLPQKAVERYRKHIKFDDYVDQGLLTVVPGATIRPQVIAQLIARIDKTFKLRRVGSDLIYSTDVANILHTEYGWDIEGPDSRYYMISQSCVSLGPAVEQLKNCILNKEIVHKGNALMDWQLRNVQVVEDTNGNRRFSKPNQDDYRKIDGWSALLNMTFVMMSDPELYPGQVFSIKV